MARSCYSIKVAARASSTRDILDVLITGTHDFKYTAVPQGRDGLVHFRGKDVFDETHTANGVTTRFLLNSPAGT
jgi:hypothetical protein